MRKNLLLSVCLLMLVFNADAAKGQRDDIKGVFSFIFPGEPQISAVEGMTNYLYPTDSCSYLVQIKPVKQSGVINDSATLNAFYGGTVKGIIRGFKGSVISEKHIRINGLSGEEVEYVRADQNRQPVSACSRILMLRGRLIVYTFSAPYSRFAALKYARDSFFASLELGGNKPSTRSDTIPPASDTGGFPTPVFDSVTARLHLVPIHRELVKSNTLRFAISFVACILLLLGLLFVWVRVRKHNKTGN